MRTILAVLTVGAAVLAHDAAQAKTDQCKVCRDYNAACTKAHTKEACKSELNICLKHCRDTK